MADAVTGIGTRREDGARETVRSPRRSDRPQAPFGVGLALIVILAIAGFAIVMPVVMTLHRPMRLRAPLPSQNQGAETLVYLLSYAVILPAALLAAPRLAGIVLAGPNRRALPVITAALTASLAIMVVAVRLSGVLAQKDGVHTVLAAAVLWWLVAGALLARAARPRAWPTLLRVAPLAAPTWGIAALLTLGAFLCLADLGSISLLGAALGAAAAVAALAAYERLRLPRVPRPGRVLLDIAIVVVVLLAVPDLLIFQPGVPGSFALAFQTSVIQFHQDFLLGPANEVLHGGAMLVDTASQYGVGSIYLLVGWFHLAPIGYGTLGFLDDAITALWFAAGYAILRMVGVSRLLAGSALGVAVVALVFNLSYPVGSLPQDGTLRFGLPMAVLLAVVAGERWPRHSRAAGAAALVVVGISSIWSLEGFVYTIATFAALACMRAWLRPRGERLGWLTRQAGLVVVVCVCTHVAFAAATLAATGRLPDWGQYLVYLHAFLFGSLGDLTYDVARWAPSLAVGAGYAASAAAVVELARRRGDFVSRERPALIAITGLTAYGIVLLSYYVDRSLDHILMHVSLPAVLIGAIWLGVLLRSRGTVSLGARRMGLAFGLAVGVLVLSVSWSAIGDRFPRSALAHAAPGGESLGGALHRLWHPPALDGGAPVGVRLLERFMPGEQKSLIIVSPDLGTEILLRSHRVDDLFLGDPWEASFVASQRLPALRRAVAALRPGKRMLVDRRALKVLALFRAHPSIDPLGAIGAFGGLARLQAWALKRIDQRFALRTIHRGPLGFAVMLLAPRHPR